VAVLDWAESIGPTGPRLHGQNGELARGFYGGLDPAPAAVTPASVAAYTQVPIAVADVTSVLLGMPPERRATGPSTVVRDDAVGAFKLVVPTAEGRALVWLEPETLAPVASETPLGGGTRLRVAFGAYGTIGALRFPHAIDMRAEPGGRVVRVRYASPSINTEIADTLFTFPPREGLEELVIDQYAAGGGDR